MIENRDNELLENIKEMKSSSVEGRSMRTKVGSNVLL